MNSNQKSKFIVIVYRKVGVCKLCVIWNAGAGWIEVEHELHNEYYYLLSIRTQSSVYISVFMLSCVGGSKAPPRTISQQDTRCECYINFL